MHPGQNASESHCAQQEGALPHQIPHGIDTSCFTGEYVTGDVSADYLAALGQHRADGAKAARGATENALTDLFASAG